MKMVKVKLMCYFDGSSYEENADRNMHNNDGNQDVLHGNLAYEQ